MSQPPEESNKQPTGPDEPDVFVRLWQGFATGVLGEPGVVSTPTAVAAGTLAAAMLVMWFWPTFFINDMPGDAMVPLDGAWRMHHGQWPHTDFYTPVGDLYYLVFVVASWFRSVTDPRILASANVIAAIPVAAAAALALRDRLPEPLAALSLTATTLVALSPRTLDEIALVGFTAMYNRWGWAASMLVAIVALLPARRQRWSDAALIATCIAAALWLKVTFAALAIGVAGVGLLFVPENRRVCGAGIAGGVVLSALSLVTHRGAVYLSDIGLAASAQDAPIRTENLLPAVDANRALLVMMVVLLFSMSRMAEPEDESELNRVSLGMVCLVGGSLFVASQNHDSSIPLLAFAPLMLFVAAQRLFSGRTLALVGAATALPLAWLVVLELRVIWMYVFLPILMGSVPLSHDQSSPLHHVRVPDPGDRTEHPMIEQVTSGRIPGDIYDNMRDQVWHVDLPIILADADALLERNDARHARIASLTFTAWFPYMLSAPPPRGLPAWYDYRRTFGEDWHERACEVLSDTEVVLVPTVWNIEGIKEQHESCLDAEFEKVDQTPLWALWRR